MIIFLFNLIYLRKDLTMNSIQFQYYQSPLGELILGSFEGKLCLCDWRYRKARRAIDSRLQKGLKALLIEENSPILKKTKQQLNEYFNHQRKTFELPTLTVGTDFQKSVWHALADVPFGDTSTYLKLAETIKNKTAIRAVANANGANALSIIIPCHRIIGSNGNMVGYAGGLPAKAKLLSLENDLFTA